LKIKEDRQRLLPKLSLKSMVKKKIFSSNLAVPCLTTLNTSVRILIK